MNSLWDLTNNPLIVSLATISLSALVLSRISRRRDEMNARRRERVEFVSEMMTLLNRAISELTGIVVSDARLTDRSEEYVHDLFANRLRFALLSENLFAGKFNTKDYEDIIFCLSAVRYAMMGSPIEERKDHARWRSVLISRWNLSDDYPDQYRDLSADLRECAHSLVQCFRASKALLAEMSHLAYEK